MEEFRINEYLTLKLENDETNIYVNGKFFRQCKYLLLNIPVDEIEDYEEVDSIDEAAASLDHSMEGGGKYDFDIPPETEFWGHCSNMQVWVEHNYDTRVLHRNLAFVLLKELTKAGDPIARIVFKEEIAKRLESDYPTVVQFLILEGYVPLLDEYELESLFITPKKSLIDSFVKLLHDECITYLKWFKKRGRTFQFVPKNKEFDPVLNTIKKLGKFRNPKLLQDIFMNSDIYALLYLYLSFQFNKYYLQNYPEYRKKITETLITGLKNEDKYIFGLSLEALVFHSYIRFSNRRRRMTPLEFMETTAGIQVKNHLKEDQYENFVLNITKKLIKYNDTALFSYSKFLDAYSEFFADFSIQARKGLELLLDQKTAELNQIAEKSLLIIKAEFGGEYRRKPEELEIATLKNLSYHELMALIPENTGKILVEEIIHQLWRDKNNETNFRDALSIFQFVGQYHAILLGEGVRSILQEYNIELLDIMFQLNLFEYLTPEECISIANQLDLSLLMQNILKVIKNRIRVDIEKMTTFGRLYDKYYGALCYFLNNLKGKLSHHKLEQIVQILDQTSLDLLLSPQLWSLVLKIQLIEPSVEEIILFFKFNNIRFPGFPTLLKWKVRETIGVISKSNNAEIALKHILTQNDKKMCINAIRSELLFEIGPKRLTSLVIEPSSNFYTIVSEIISTFHPSSKKKYIRLLEEIKNLASIDNISDEDFRNNMELREDLADKDQLKHLERNQFWRVLPAKIIKLKEIEEITQNNFEYISSKQFNNYYGKNGLSLSLKNDDLTLFNASQCQLSNTQIEKVFEILIEFPSLIKLYLSYNNFQILPNSINIFKNLEQLGLSHSGITSLSEEIGELRSLEQLYLRGTMLTQLPLSIGTLKSLKNLNLEYCEELSAIPPSIGKLSSLEFLGLNKTKIKSLPANIGNLVNLNRLSIEGCPIRELPESIGDLQKLEYIHIAETNIEFLPDSMKNLKNLKYLQVSNYYKYDFPKLRALIKPLKEIPVRIGFKDFSLDVILPIEIFRNW